MSHGLPDPQDAKHTVGRREAAADHHAGNPEASIGNVTHRAAVGALKLRFARLPLLQGIKDDALLGILGCQLHEPPAHPSDGNGVTKEYGPGIFGLNEGGLQAGLREDGNLRFDGNAEQFQYRPQIAVSILEFEVDYALLNPAAELANDISG